MNFTGIAPGQKFAGLTNYTVTDGMHDVVVRVSTTTQSLVGQPIPTGPVNLSGIFTEFDGSDPLPGVAGTGYELALLDNSSITAVPEPSAFALMTIAGGLTLSFLNRRQAITP